MKNFKFTWGHGVVLALLSFMIFIISFLVRFQYQQENSMDLVTEDYYNKGLRYQDEYDAIERAKALPMRPEVAEVNGQLKVLFPDSLQVKDGKLSIYRPSDKNLDFTLPLRLEDHQLWVKNEAFKKGKYVIDVYWKDSADVSYLFRENIIWK